MDFVDRKLLNCTF